MQLDRLVDGFLSEHGYFRPALVEVVTALEENLAVALKDLAEMDDPDEKGD